MVIKIAEDVWRIKGRGSVYVILDDVPIVIDAGDREDFEFIKKEIEKIVSLEKIKIVLLTHLHYDHVGCIDLFPNAKIYADKKEIEDYQLNSEGFYFYVGEVDDILTKKMRPLPDEIGGLKVLRVPGHTRGAVAFLDEKHKVLFSGDTLFANDIIGRTDLPNSVPVKMDESVEMLRKLIKEKNLVLCPGHGYWL